MDGRFLFCLPHETQCQHDQGDGHKEDQAARNIQAARRAISVHVQIQWAKAERGKDDDAGEGDSGEVG